MFEYDDADDDGYTEADIVTAARLAALEERERGTLALLRFAAEVNAPASVVLKALSGSAAATEEADSPDEIIDAALALIEGGEHPADVAELLAERLPHGKAWDESKHKRDHGKFSSTGGSGAGEKKDADGNKPPSKRALKQAKRSEAVTAASGLLKQRAAGKPLDGSQARELLEHLGHLTHDDLKALRKEHGAAFGGESSKSGRVNALVKWAKNELGARRRAQQGSALQQVVDYGGIDPQSEDFKRFYGSMKDAVNDGIPMAAFKRGGNGLDEIAAQMVSAGHINLPDWEDPSEHLMGLLRGRKMLNWGNEDKKHEDAYAEHVAGMPDTGEKFDPNKMWDDEDPDWFSKAAAHAPKGGVSVQGTEYTGGQFIPADVMASATDEEKAAVEGKGGEKEESAGALPQFNLSSGDNVSTDATRVRPQVAYDALAEVFGTEDAGEQCSHLASCLGFPDESEINIVSVEREDGETQIGVEVEHPKIEYAQRTFILKPDGSRVIVNDSVKVKDEFQGTGFGAEFFARQAVAASSLGFDRIETYAMRDEGPPPSFGHYVWPLFGYDQSLEDGAATPVARVRDAFRAAQAAFPDAKSIGDIMQTEEGRKWWKANGADASSAAFDLKPESRSMRVLAAYLKNRAEKKSGSQKMKKSISNERGPNWTQPTHNNHTPAELLAAAVEVVRRAREDGTDPQDALDALHALGMGGTFGKAWDSNKHPRGDDGRFIKVADIKAAKKDPAKANALRERVTNPEERKKLDNALHSDELSGSTRDVERHASQVRREQVQANRTLARKLRIKLADQESRGEALDPDDLRALIPHLSTMTQDELSTTRVMLERSGASFGGKRLRADRVAALTQWALDTASGKTDEPAPEKPEAEGGSAAGAGVDAKPDWQEAYNAAKSEHAEQMLEAMKRAWGRGESVVFPSSMRSRIFPPSAADNMRVRGGEVQMRVGKEWQTIPSGGGEYLRMARTLGAPKPPSIADYMPNEPVDERFAWQIPKDEWVNSDPDENVPDYHRWHVETALQGGSSVPAEVLADYPDLAAKYAKPDAGTAADQGKPDDEDARRAKQHHDAKFSGPVRDEIREYRKLGMDPGTINSGECLPFAQRVIAAIRKKGQQAEFGAPKGDLHHVWVVANGKHYDAQHPDGVDDPKDLTFFQDNPELLARGWASTPSEPVSDRLARGENVAANIAQDAVAPVPRGAVRTSANTPAAQGKPPKTRLQAQAERARAANPPPDPNAEFATPREQYQAFLRYAHPDDAAKKPDAGAVAEYLSKLPDGAREKLDQHFASAGKSLAQVEAFHRARMAEATPEPTPRATSEQPAAVPHDQAVQDFRAALVKEAEARAHRYFTIDGGGRFNDAGRARTSRQREKRPYKTPASFEPYAQFSSLKERFSDAVRAGEMTPEKLEEFKAKFERFRRGDFSEPATAEQIARNQQAQERIRAREAEAAQARQERKQGTERNAQRIAQQGFDIRKIHSDLFGGDGTHTLADGRKVDWEVVDDAGQMIGENTPADANWNYRYRITHPDGTVTTSGKYASRSRLQDSGELRKMLTAPVPGTAAAKPEPVPGGAPKAPDVSALKRNPKVDAEHLNALAARTTDPAVKDAIESAAWNLDGVTGDETARRRATLEQLAASHRALHDGGNAAGAEAVADVVRQYGGKLHGPAVGQPAAGDGRYYEMPAGTFTGDNLTVKRQPVVHTDARGREFVASKGELASGTAAATGVDTGTAGGNTTPTQGGSAMNGNAGGGEPPKVPPVASGAGDFNFPNDHRDLVASVRKHSEGELYKPEEGKELLRRYGLDFDAPEFLNPYTKRHLDATFQSEASKVAQADPPSVLHSLRHERTGPALRAALQRRLAHLESDPATDSVTVHYQAPGANGLRAKQTTWAEHKAWRATPKRKHAIEGENASWNPDRETRTINVQRKGDTVPGVGVVADVRNMYGYNEYLIRPFTAKEKAEDDRKAQEAAAKRAAADATPYYDRLPG